MEFEYAIKLACGQIEVDDIPIMFRQPAQDLQNTEELLDYIQNKKWDEIKAERDRLETAGIPFKGKYLDYDLRSVMKLTKAATGLRRLINQGKATEETTIDWTMNDNSIMPLTCNELEEVDIIAMGYSNTLHEKGRLLRETIFANSNIIEIYNIKWE